MLVALCALSLERTAWAHGCAYPFRDITYRGTLDSRSDWEPLCNDMSRALGRSIVLSSFPTYGGLEQAIKRDMVDMAFLSGKLALDAVTLHAMRVVAQVYRKDELTGYRAVLVARNDAGPVDVEDLLREPGRWRLARGEKSSLSGYVVPELQLFLRRGVTMETAFRGELVGSHQTLALAVVNGEADIAINNTADLERFAYQFPMEACRLRTIWESELIPHAQIVMRSSFPVELVNRVQAFLSGYGAGDSREAEDQRNVLKGVSNIAGFRLADNSSLLGSAKLTYDLAKQSALAARFINEAARRKRLDSIEKTYADQKAVLQKNSASPC